MKGVYCFMARDRKNAAAPIWVEKMDIGNLINNIMGNERLSALTSAGSAALMTAKPRQRNG